MKPLGFVGYGRFGQALAQIFLERGLDVQATDPGWADGPPLTQLVAECEFLFVAVPVPAMQRTFSELQTLLSPEQVVIDVGSVKLTPYRAMDEIFGSRQPWVATHPLFGPVSLARAEAGLRVVICPNGAHREAERAVAKLFESIGCQVIEMDPETHDRIMAQTHALAFFIAKGMLDASVPTDSPAAPPSFQAMARTIESVRGDAGHLLTTLHRENPFAPEYRRRLLDILVELDNRLNDHASLTTGQEDDTLTIRSESRSVDGDHPLNPIDEVDAELVALLARRVELARRSRKSGQKANDADLLLKRMQWARDAGLDDVAVGELFAAAMKLSIETA